MKESSFNVIFPLGEGMYLLYNALSGGFAKVDTQTLDLLTTTGTTSDPQVSFVRENLEKGKFILPEDFDELDYLKILMNANKFGGHSLGLTIAPTLECNFSCTYCYESHPHVRMSSETVAAVKTFLENELKHAGGLGVTWFGGEPLLAFDIIQDISQFIFELQKKKEFHFEAGIVTNGYLMTKQRAQEMRELQIGHTQVTIDGPAAVHDGRRSLRSGGGTFERVMGNVGEAADFLKISLRVNVDTTNVERVPELFDILLDCGLKEKVRVYFAPVLEVGSSCRDISATCMTYEMYSRHEIALYQKALEKGMGIAKYPTPLHGLCGAVRMNAFLIDPYGHFHKCWNTVGIEDEAVGKVGEPLQMGSRLVEWLSWDPFEREECRTCKVLPLCMGGCPYLRRTREVNCTPWKYNLEEMLRLYYTQKAQ